MSKELFIALSGGMAYQRQLEVVANNVANVATSGFKQDRTVFSVARPEFEKQARVTPPQGSPAYLLANSYADAAISYVDFSGGAIEQTGNNLHAALEGDGFFAIQGKNETLYSRSGQFKVSKDGTLVNHMGLPVLGEKGPIQVPTSGIQIGPDGSVSAEGKFLDKLRVEGFAADAQLEKVGDTMFSARGSTARPVPNTEVLQGALERSNVDPIRGMMELITVQRNYESFTKVITNMNEIDSKTNARVKV